MRTYRFGFVTDSPSSCRSERRTKTCEDVNEINYVYNSVFVAPDGMNVFFAAGGIVKGYRTHTVVPHTPSPTEAPTPSPVMPTPSPTPGDGGISTCNKYHSESKCAQVVRKCVAR